MKKISRTYGGVDASTRKNERRKKLIEAGIEAFGTKGYAKTNIKTICALAGLTERYFYESFSNKEDLLYTIYRELIDEQQREAIELLSELDSDPIQTATKATEMFYHRFKIDPRIARIQLFEVLGVSQRIDQAYRDAIRLLSEMVKLFLLRIFPGIPQEKLNNSIIPTGIAGSMIMIAYDWVLGGFVMPIDDIIGQSMYYFMIIGKHLDAGHDHS
ncbi:MAG TPA: TetR/AcrR family transcriptional regulator [Deltaproteobacteria bacterium]|nr:TetR/AcrR family transcriptional regulator [Deltaproteobacteria bacterium]HPP80103.1 TetR/AcrR family transcriptional regulator [Deltaproteobacteria bacterium]